MTWKVTETSKSGKILHFCMKHFCMIYVFHKLIDDKLRKAYLK
jgi:hypothetical protein